jgi:hypothetical protein
MEQSMQQPIQGSWLEMETKFTTTSTMTALKRSKEFFRLSFPGLLFHMAVKYLGGLLILSFTRVFIFQLREIVKGYIFNMSYIDTELK